MAAKQKILVVDDDPNLNRLLQFALLGEGFSVSIATSGLAGIEEALSERPDLAIVDVNMPELDGFEVCRRLRATPMLAHIPIILLTARADVKDKLTGFEAGADDYVVKPVAIEELLARIKVLLQRTGPSAQAEVPQPRGEGQIWSLFSLKGGVGVSSLAVNLAIVLRQNWADSVALVDLNTVCGTIESMLNLPPSTMRLTSRERLGPEDWDEGFIRQLLRSHQSQVEVLSVPSSPTGESFFRFPLAGEIPYGGAAFLSSVNLGVPLLLNHPTHPTAMALRELARKLITRQPELARSPAEESRGILGRLRSRYARA